MVAGLVLVIWRRGWRRRPTTDPEAQAAELLADLRALDASGDSDAPERRAAAKHALLAILERRPEVLGDLRRSGRSPRETPSDQT